jgi:hypothetical protein
MSLIVQWIIYFLKPLAVGSVAREPKLGLLSKSSNDLALLRGTAYPLGSDGPATYR